MALHQRALPTSRWHVLAAALWLAVSSVALVVAFAVPIAAAGPDEAVKDETAQAPAESNAPAPEEEEPSAGEEPNAGAKEPPKGIEVITIQGAPEEVMKDEASSVQRFDLEELQKIGAQNISDLAKVTPNLEIKTLSATTPTFFIRGVGLNDFSANAGGAVAIYRDGVPINSPALQLIPLFDIQNIDVLRGPEGFDDNRGASAGAIRTVSNEPTGQYEAAFRTDYGITYNMRDYQGMISLPVAEDWLSARGAFRLTQRDPFYRNRCGNTDDNQPPLNPDLTRVCNETVTGSRDTPIPKSLPQEVNDWDRWAARGLFRLQPPGTDMDWVLNVHGSELHEQSQLGQVWGIASGQAFREPFPGGAVVIPAGAPASAGGYYDPKIGKIYKAIRASMIASNNLLPPAQRLSGAQINQNARIATIAKVAKKIEESDPYKNDYNLVGMEHNDTVGTTLDGQFSLGPVRATSITGWENYKRKRTQDFDFSSNPILALSPQDRAWQATQNLNFEWSPTDWFPGTLRWGGYFLREELDSHSFFDVRPNAISSADPRLFQSFQDYTQDTNSAGVFGNFRWDFADGFTLQGGARYNFEDKSFEETVIPLLIPPGLTVGAPVNVNKTWSAPTGGLNLTYNFTDEINAYVKYTHGWKGGQIQGNSLRTSQGQASIFAANPTVADPENIDAFEIGSHAGWFDGRLQMDGDLFFYHYQDYQVFVFENQFGGVPQLKIINANDARVYGAEMNVRTQPLQGFVPSFFEDLSISGRFGWIESEFLDFTDTRIIQFTPTQGQTHVFSATVDFTGNRLPNTPRFKFSGTVDYKFDLGRWGTTGVRYDLNWTDDINYDPSNGRGVTASPILGNFPLPKYSIGQKAYMLQDLQVHYGFPSSSIELTAWIKNIEDIRYKSYVADTTVAFQSVENWIGEPRTYGVTLGVTF